jgi:hypothetical protein
MVLKTPTPVSFPRAVWLCWLAITAPAKFDAEERLDSELLNKQPYQEPMPRIFVLRRALGESLLSAITSAITGGVFGLVAAWFSGPQGTTVTALAVFGTGILLWGTLAVRGWDIQTFNSASLTERVNRWLFRFLYRVGTASIVMAATWGVVAQG